MELLVFTGKGRPLLCIFGLLVLDVELSRSIDYNSFPFSTLLFLCGGGLEALPFSLYILLSDDFEFEGIIFFTPPVIDPGNKC